jgi:hypothetical protein
MGTFEKASANSFEKACKQFLLKNNELHGKNLAFKYQQEYYPKQELSRTAQRNYSAPLDESLVEEFESYHQVFVTEFDVVQRKFQHYLSKVFRKSRSQDELMAMLPASFDCISKELYFVPSPIAKGFTDAEKQELLEKHQDLFIEIDKYMMTKVLI